MDPERHLRVDHLEDDLTRRSLRGGAAMLTGQAARFVLQVGSTMLLARLLTPEDFGLVAMLVCRPKVQVSGHGRHVKPLRGPSAGRPTSPRRQRFAEIAAAVPEDDAREAP